MYSSLAKWFKCNAKRYFEINVDSLKIERNGVARLCQGGFDSDFYPSYNTWYQKPSVIVGSGRNMAGYNIGICQGQLGHNRQSGRIGETKIPEATSRYGFFISEVRYHYDILNRQVYEPLSSLGLNPIVNPYEYPSWKSRLKVYGCVPDDFFTDMATRHISGDMPNLLNEIIEYRNRLRLHIKNVNLLPRIVDSIVKSKFIEAGVFPTSPDNYRKDGYYHFGDVDHVLNVDICEGFLLGDRDVRTFARNFNFLNREFSEDDRFLKTWRAYYR